MDFSTLIWGFSVWWARRREEAKCFLSFNYFLIFYFTLDYRSSCDVHSDPDSIWSLTEDVKCSSCLCFLVCSTRFYYHHRGSLSWFCTQEAEVEHCSSVPCAEFNKRFFFVIFSHRKLFIVSVKKRFWEKLKAHFPCKMNFNFLYRVIKLVSSELKALTYLFSFLFPSQIIHKEKSFLFFWLSFMRRESFAIQRKISCFRAKPLVHQSSSSIKKLACYKNHFRQVF